MTLTRRDMRMAAVAWMALTAPGCSEGAGPTAWIPKNGDVSGTITTTSAAAAPPITGPIVNGGGLALPAPTASLVARGTPASFPRPQRAGASRARYTTHDLIVTFQHAALDVPPIGAGALARVTTARALRAAIQSRLVTIMPAGGEVAGVSPVILAAKVRVADTAQLAAVAAALRQDPAVAAVTRNRLVWLDEAAPALNAAVPAEAAAPRTTPNNPLYAFQTWHYDLIDLPRAWSITTGSATVLVGVVDDGIRFDHPAIAPNVTSDGYDFVNGDDSLPLCTGGKIANSGDGNGYDSDPTIPSSYNADQTGCFRPGTLGAHGLHVAGTIGAVGNDGIGMTGVNWMVRIRPVRVLGIGGVGASYDVAQGILYAAGLPADNGSGGTVQASTGARIINLSLGGADDDPMLHDAIVSAANAGVLIVAAAGNGGTSAPFYPAAYPEVLAVAAVGPDALPTSYSNFGSYVALRAPGGDFNLGGASGGGGSTLWNFGTNAADYGFATGTSMAAPHVSGVAALVLAQNPALTAVALRTRLTSYAVGPATSYGAGLVNAYNSLTQSLGPPTQVYARLYSATTGAIGQTVLAQANGAFAFTHVQDGSYFVFGGSDESGDQQLGVPGRLWGALGNSAIPTSILVLDAAPHPASFSIGYPTPLQADHSIQTPNILVIGGYTQGAITSPQLVDAYRVKIPQTGTYTFETTGWVGACGLALEEATAVGLFDTAGKLLASAGYLDASHYNYCSRLTFSLSPGTYLIAVAGAFSGGRYRLQARAGS